MCAREQVENYVIPITVIGLLTAWALVVVVLYSLFGG